MNIDKLKKSIIWGVSTVIGLAIAEGIYRASSSAIDRRELIGDGEVVSDEIVEDEELTDEDLPF